MTTLTVLKFPSANGAQQAQNTLLDLQKQQLIDVQDAAIVTWPQGKTPKTEQLHSLAGQGALTGAFWGMLLGVIFFVPFFGLALGAAIGALSAKFNDYGIDDNFIKQTRERDGRHLGLIPADKWCGGGQGSGGAKRPDVRDHCDEFAESERRRAACGVRCRVAGQEPEQVTVKSVLDRVPGQAVSTQGDATMGKKKDKKNKKGQAEAHAGTVAAANGSAPKVAAEPKAKLSRKEFESELEKLQVELVKLQEWVKVSGAKVCVLFEGRDAAGKGGIIKRLTERTSPRVFRVVALPSPTEREKSQMYFQRYMPHLPAAGEIVLFDRSWYNRAGVERVMGYRHGGTGRILPEVCAARRTGHHPLRRHPGQVLAGRDHGRPDRALHGTHRGLPQDLEAQPHGPGKPPPLV